MREKYYWNIVPTIANETMCSFSFEVLKRGLLKDKVVYTGFFIFNRELEVITSNQNAFGRQPLNQKLKHIVNGAEYNSVEHMCRLYAEVIFDQFK